MVDFTLIGQIEDIETFAIGGRIREVRRLRKKYGKGRWRKRKGVATVRLGDGASSKPSCIGTKRPALAGAN